MNINNQQYNARLQCPVCGAKVGNKKEEHFREMHPEYEFNVRKYKAGSRSYECVVEKTVYSQMGKYVEHFWSAHLQSRGIEVPLAVKMLSPDFGPELVASTTKDSSVELARTVETELTGKILQEVGLEQFKGSVTWLIAENQQLREDNRRKDALLKNWEKLAGELNDSIQRLKDK